jgi:hypothetical protein
MWLRIGFNYLYEHFTSLPDSVKALKFLAGRATIRFSRSRPSFYIKTEAFVFTFFDPLSSLLLSTYYTNVGLVCARKFQTQINKKQNKQTKRKTGNSKVKGNASGFLFFL